MVKTYQQVNREHHEREREEHHERKHRKYTLLIIVALLVAFVGIMLAQNAQDTADVNNVFEIVVNNTNLAPSVAGHPPGTGERVSGTTYWANNSPIEIFVFAHAMAVGDNAEIHLFINGTKVADTSGRPLGGAESSNKTIIAIIPKFSNYSVEFTNFHHYEWREYPVLSGKNGTLSINQSLVGSSFNATYEANISALQRNDTYFNGTVFNQSESFRNDSIPPLQNNDTTQNAKILSLELNDSAVPVDYSSTSTVVGWSSTTTKSIFYEKVDNVVYVTFDIRGTSNSGSATFTVPYTSSSANSFYTGSLMETEDNGVFLTTPGRVFMNAGSSTVNINKDQAGNTFTATGTKAVIGSIWFFV